MSAFLAASAVLSWQEAMTTVAIVALAALVIVCSLRG
jgi:hypothetical protein